MDLRGPKPILAPQPIAPQAHLRARRLIPAQRGAGEFLALNAEVQAQQQIGGRVITLDHRCLDRDQRRIRVEHVREQQAQCGPAIALPLPGRRHPVGQLGGAAGVADENRRARPYHGLSGLVVGGDGEVVTAAGRQIPARLPHPLPGQPARPGHGKTDHPVRHGAVAALLDDGRNVGLLEGPQAHPVCAQGSHG